MINKYVVQACKDRAFLESNRSLFSNPSWLNENGIFNDQVAIENISGYIKQYWNLEKKYTYSVEKSSLKMIDVSCHSYKVNLTILFQTIKRHLYFTKFKLESAKSIIDFKILINIICII
jgi:hypothetical protein